MSADAVGTAWATFRAQYEYGSRTGSDLDEQALIDIGEHPEMRHYDLADRTRNRFTGQVDIVPSDVWTFSVSGGVLHDDYPDTVFGLQNVDRAHLLARRRLPRCRTASARVPPTTSSGMRDSSNRTKADSSAAQFNDPPAQLDGRLDRDRQLLFHLRDAAPHRPEHRGAVLVRFQPRERQLPLYDSRGQPDCDAQSAAGRVQQAAAAARRRAPPDDEESRCHRSPISTSRSASTTSRSIPAWSTASSSPARWSWGTSTVPTPRTPSSSACRYLW